MTGALLAGPVLLLVAFGEWRGYSSNICEGLFGLFAVAALGPRLLSRRAAAGLAAGLYARLLAALVLRWQTTRSFVDHAWNVR
ncbi:hypothetical protein [Bradyrhizobium sp. CCBAU 45394]|uniref:hypothetical protein n=1 Tax=Bradyrhizobium sp. CCBAU 45394 TaxID=1325087 RepID=UPI0023047BCE|nr:hypothetical protein [Bradyrhizobium sp. CCBAU 45394]